MKDQLVFLDSNVLIAAKNDIYPFDVFPSFWEFIEKAIMSGKLVVLKVVKDEILAGNDELTTWLKKLNPHIMPINDQNIVDVYAQISEYVYSLSSQYSPAVIDSWFGNIKVADPWLIAAAVAYKGQIVTNETELKPNAKKRLIIPNIASHFSIPCIKTIQMMRAFNVKL